MNTLRVLSHLMRADFFERTRHYSFLITIGLTIYVAYLYLPPSCANYLGFSLGGVRSIYNSAWIGSIIAVRFSTLLIVPGFYLVKDSITRGGNYRHNSHQQVEVCDGENAQQLCLPYRYGRRNRGAWD